MSEKTRRTIDISNPGKRKALIISVSDYSDKKLPKLDFCRKDGEQMYEVLKGLDYEITDNRKLIGNVRFDTMRDSIYDFFDNRKTAAHDILLFYYSGHGVPISEGNMCLASSETDSGNPKKRGFTSYDLTNLIQESNSIRIVEILDYCHSGANKLSKGDEATSAKLGKVVIESNKRILQQQGEGKYLLAASQAAQEAFGLKEKDQSIFTYYLLEGLRGRKDSVDADGNVTPYSLGKYAYTAILNLPPDRRPTQQPVTKTDASGELILAHYPSLKVQPVDLQPVAEVQAIKKCDELFYREEFNKAIECYDRAIQLDPDNVDPWYKKSEILYNQGHYDLAIACYDKILSINSNHFDLRAYESKAKALSKLKNFDEAIRYYKGILAGEHTLFQTYCDSKRKWFTLGQVRKDK